MSKATTENSKQEATNVPITVSAPALPPHLVEAKVQTVDEVAADLKKSPFFMTSLDDASEDNYELEAIRALMYEGTRAEVAESFREQGNELAKMKKWKDSKELYSKGLLALRAPRKAEDSSGEDEDKRERSVQEACLVNRALCNLELRILSNSSTYRLF